jgi:hypothetical protein
MFQLVLLTSVLGKPLLQTTHESESTKREQSSHKKQSQGKQSQENQCFVSELSLEVVVPSHAFEFGDEFIILPHPQIIYLEESAPNKVFSKPIYRLSYFDKLFEHQIAVNAP